MRSAKLLLLILALSPSLAAPAGAQRPSAGVVRTLPDSIRDFAGLSGRLSEPGGYFDTDNLISNEGSYLHVVGEFPGLGVRGGAYIGVGPDQNFSYIAHIRPRVAFIIDIRRDNMLQQLMFKALFARARNRAEYLSLLLGKPLPTAPAGLADASLQSIIASIDSVPVSTASSAAARNAVNREVRRFGIRLSDADLATIARFHDTFIGAGFSLQFTSTGRSPRYYYPTLRQLLLERDAAGNPASYLAREADFQFIKSMQRRNLIVPVVGDLAGSHALRAIGAYVAEHNEKVSAIYVSNAEDYIIRGGTFVNYARTIASLPRNRSSVMIRSYFGGPGAHPLSIGSYYSTQLLQSIDEFVQLSPTVRSYRMLVSRFIPSRR